jgi:hypothetical protein
MEKGKNLAKNKIYLEEQSDNNKFPPIKNERDPFIKWF